MPNVVPRYGVLTRRRKVLLGTEHVLFAPEPVFSIISTAKSVYCISYCKLFVSHSVKICRRENASPQSVVSSQQDKMVIKEDLAKSRVSRLRLN